MCVFNFLNAIIQTASGFNGLRILSSVMLGVCYSLLMTYLVYAVYRGYLIDQRSILRYKIGQIFMLVVLLLAVILHILSWNGIVRMVQVFDEGSGFAGVMCIVEFFLTLALGGFMGWNLLGVYKTPTTA